MAFLKPAKEKEPAAKDAQPLAPPAVPPDALITAPMAQPKVAMDGTVTKPPPQISVVMSVDGGINGQCWRAGATVVLDPEAADLYLAKGFAKRAP